MKVNPLTVNPILFTSFIEQTKLTRLCQETQEEKFESKGFSEELTKYKSAISAKEKTGVDPLSQVGKPMADSQNVSLREAMLPNLADDASSTYSTKSSRSWTGHRSTPKYCE